MATATLWARLPNTRDQFVPVLIDKAMEGITRDYRWRLSTKGYVMASHRCQLLYLHLVVAGGRATHINGDSLDNRIENLHRF